MADETKSVLDAVTALEKTVEAKSGLTSKEIAEIKKLAEDSEKKHKEDWDKLSEEVKAKGGLIVDLQEEVKNLKAKNGKKNAFFEDAIPSLKSAIADAIGEHKGKIMEQKEGMAALAMEVKAPALVTSANLSGTAYRTFMPWQPGMEPIPQNHIRDFLRVVQSETDNVSFPRANTPIGEGSFGFQTDETADKNQVDRDYTMIDLTLNPFAGWILMSRKSLRNIIFLQSWLPTSLTEQLAQNEDAAFSAQLIAVAGSITGYDTTTAIGKVVGAISSLITAGYNPGAIPVDAAAWQAVILNKSTEGLYNQPNIVTVDAMGTTRVLGRPLIPVPWLTGGRVIVGDWSRAAIVESEGLTLRQSDSHNGIFIKNQIVWLLERVEGLMINRPDAFKTGILTS